MAPWTPFPHAGDYAWDATRVQQQWSQLHLGDAEPLPQDPAVLHAWALFHNGEFQKAAEAGLAAGGAGIDPVAVLLGHKHQLVVGLSHVCKSVVFALLKDQRLECPADVEQKPRAACPAGHIADSARTHGVVRGKKRLSVVAQSGKACGELGKNQLIGMGGGGIAELAHRRPVPVDQGQGGAGNEVAAEQRARWSCDGRLLLGARQRAQILSFVNLQRMF